MRIEKLIWEGLTGIAAARARGRAESGPYAPAGAWLHASAGAGQDSAPRGIGDKLAPCMQ